MFSVVNEREAAEQKLYNLRQNESAATYAAEFQWIAVLTEWNNQVLNSKFYWSLKKVIKDEIVRSDRSDELQDIINMTISIDEQIHEC